MQPPKTNNRIYDCSFLIRLRVDQLEKLRTDAQKSGSSVSSYARQMLGLEPVAKDAEGYAASRAKKDA